MGMFKQLKDMKGMVADAPAMIQSAQEMGAQAQEMAALQQQQAMAAQQAAFAQPGVAAGGLDAAATEPIAGVSLEQYADISRGLQAYNYDQSKAVEIAAGQGVSAENWQAAVDGWNARMQANPAVAKEFNRLYTGR
jgi:hypothetical protein